MDTPMTAVNAFVAGFLSVVTIMSASWWLMRASGFIPADACPTGAFEHAVPRFGVPRVFYLAFWGGVWGLLLNLLCRNLCGVGYWPASTLAASIAVAGTAA